MCNSLRACLPLVERLSSGFLNGLQLPEGGDFPADCIMQVGKHLTVNQAQTLTEAQSFI
jgi:hypothetical protein